MRMGNIFLVINKASADKIARHLEVLLPESGILFENKHLHHITLRYATNLDQFWMDFSSLTINSNHLVQVVSCSYDDKAQALIIKLSEELEDVYERDYPHISVSTERGVKPGCSEEMLGGPHQVLRFEQPFSIEATLEELEFRK